MILLRKARIYDIRSKHHDQVKDVLIEKGSITNISNRITAPEKAKVISSSSLCISPGWLDIGTYNGDPGFEYREDLDSLRAAAIRGGYVAIAPFPSGQPSIDNKGQLHFLKSQTSGHIVDVHPIASISRGQEGRDLADLLDLSVAGAVAFSDGDETSLSQGLAIRALQYLKSCDGVVVLPAYQKEHAHVHEGSASVVMGLEGMPTAREVSAVETILSAQTYTSGKVLIHNISSKESLSRIGKPTQQVHISVPALNLVKDDSDVIDFTLSLKVNPPLRSKQDRRALEKAVENGTVNIISSHHRPLSIDEKDQPFGISAFGASTLETVFSSVRHYTDISVARIAHNLSVGPHEALELDCPVIETGAKAYLSLFDAEEATSVNDTQSKGSNLPFEGEELTGKVIGIINGNRSAIL